MGNIIILIVLLIIIVLSKIRIMIKIMKPGGKLSLPLSPFLSREGSGERNLAVDLSLDFLSQGKHALLIKPGLYP